MENQTFAWQDYSVFGGLLAGSTLIGVYYAWKDRQAKDSDAFLSLKDAQFGLLPVSISLIASYISAITILAFPGEMYTHGSQFWFACLGILIAVAITDLVFLPVIYYMDLTSINEYFSRRFGSNLLRQMCSVASIFATMFYLGAVLFGPSLAISSVTDMNVYMSVVTIGIVCTFYTTIGGLKAVIWTDVIQMVIMTVGLFVVVIKVSNDVGGMKRVFEIADEGGRIEFFNTEFHVFEPSPTFWDSILQPAITWTAALAVSQTGYQRLSGMQTFKKARILTWLNIPGVFLMSSLAFMSGIAIYARYSKCDPFLTGAIDKPDQLMPYYVMEAFEHLPGLPGLFVACVFSASLSSLSSGLNATAAITWGDFLKKHFNVSGKKEILITKAIAVAYGAIVIGIAFLSSNVGSILQAAGMLAAPMNGALFAIMTLGVLCPFANYKGAVAGLSSSFVFTLWTGVGGAVTSRPQEMLPGSTEGCPFNVSEAIRNSTQTDAFEVPSGIKAMQYLSPYFVGTASYVLCFLISITVSLATGGARGQCIPSSLVHPCIIRLSKKYQKNRKLSFLFPEFTEETVPTTAVLEDSSKLKPDAEVDKNKTRF